MGDYTFFSLNKTFLPSFSFGFFHTSLRNDLVLAQISATNWKLYKLRRQRKEEKKSFRTLSLLLRQHGAQHAGKESNRFILASDTLFFVQSCPNLSDLG